MNRTQWAVAPEGSAAVEVSSTMSSTARQKRILVVDDDPNVREMVATISMNTTSAPPPRSDGSR
jgi:hypothetical protein